MSKKVWLKEDGRHHLTLNLTVPHKLVDGFSLAAGFNDSKSRYLAPRPILVK